MVKTIKNILVPINFSDNVYNAVKTGIAMCQRHGAVLHLLYVQELNRNVFPPGKSAALLGLRLDAKAKHLAWLEAKAKRIMKNNAITCFYHTTSGSFHQSVASKARDLYCDLIIIEKNKPILPVSFFRRNSIYKILKLASCPVLSVPSIEKSLKFKKVLFPLRPIRASLKKLDYTLPILKRNSSEVLLFGLVSPFFEKNERDTVDALVTKADEEISKMDITVDKEITAAGDMARRVVDKAVESDSDLIIINATLSKGLQSIFSKGYTERVIETSGVPVLSVKF